MRCEIQFHTSVRSKHITNSYLEDTIEDHIIHTHFSETMMALAKLKGSLFVDTFITDEESVHGFRKILCWFFW